MVKHRMRPLPQRESPTAVNVTVRKRQKISINVGKRMVDFSLSGCGVRFMRNGRGRMLVAFNCFTFV